MTSSFSTFSQPREYNPGVTEESREEAAELQAIEDNKSQESGADTLGNSFEPGVFNFAQIMEDFYNYQPEEGDEIGQLQKSAFQGNLVQTGFDAMLASALADQNSANAQENMKVQADLEKLNSLDLMQAEFGYNELSKESNYNYENSFANAQYDRDIGMLAATGEQQRDNIKEQSNQDRLTNIVQGEQQRLTDAQNIASQERIATGQFASNDYQADKAAEASMFGSQASADASRDVATTQAASADYGADQQLEAQRLRTQADKDITDTQTQSAELITDKQTGSAERITDKETGSAERITDKQTGSAERITDTQTQSQERITDTRTEADKAIADRTARASEYGSDKQLEGVKDTNVTSTRNIRATGEETRSTQDNEQRLKARERADMSRYSRRMARAN
jgi:hypothetical protein